MRILTTGGQVYFQSATSDVSDSRADINFTSQYAATTYLKIQGSTGNVGIGTADPQATLHVYGPGSTHGLISRLGGYDGALDIGTLPTTYGAETIYMQTKIDGGGTGYVGERQVMALQPDAGGRVGIGSTQPQATLDVVGDVGITGQMNITKSATYGRVMRLGVTSGGTGMGFYMGTGGTDNNWANTGIPLQNDNSGGGTILFMFNMNSSGNDSTSSQFWVLRKSYSTAWVQNSSNAYLIKHLNGGGGGTMTFQRSSNLLQYRNSGGGNGHFYAIECD